MAKKAKKAKQAQLAKEAIAAVQQLRTLLSERGGGDQVLNTLLPAELKWLVANGWNTTDALEGATAEQLKGVAGGRASVICKAFSVPVPNLPATSMDRQGLQLQLSLQVQELIAELVEVNVKEQVEVKVKEQVEAKVQELQPLLSVVATMLDYDEGSASTVTNIQFKQSLATTYSSIAFRNTLYCMLTHVYLPSAIVIAAYLWKRSWHRAIGLMDFEDIHDIRNGLLLSKPLEWAFHAGYLSIIPGRTFEPSVFQAVLMNPALKEVPLIEKLKELLQASRTSLDSQQLADIDTQWTHNGAKLTFGDMHGRMLKSGKSGSPPKPYARVLEYQYRNSQKNGRQPQGPVPECHGSPLWVDKVKTYFRSIGYEY